MTHGPVMSQQVQVCPGAWRWPSVDPGSLVPLSAADWHRKTDIKLNDQEEDKSPCNHAPSEPCFPCEGHLVGSPSWLEATPKASHLSFVSKVMGLKSKHLEFFLALTLSHSTSLNLALLTVK